jgi:hypothetical protein
VPVFQHNDVISNVDSIIAIMLGRLEMGVDECIETYTDMFGSIFGKKGLPVDWRGRVKGRFDSVVLEECIQDILRRRGLSIDEPLENPQHARCRV